MRKSILSFNDFHSSMNEADEKKKGKEEAGKEPVELPKEEKVDTSGGQYKEMNIDGKDYMAVLSTLTAIGSKQEAMGEKKVGIISLPGDAKVYELVPKGEGGEEKSNESEVNESGYLEVMNMIQIANGLAEIEKAWNEWKSGPATEPKDIKPAQKDLKNFIDDFLKKAIK